MKTTQAAIWEIPLVYPYAFAKSSISMPRLSFQNGSFCCVGSFLCGCGYSSSWCKTDFKANSAYYKNISAGIWCLVESILSHWCTSRRKLVKTAVRIDYFEENMLCNYKIYQNQFASLNHNLRIALLIKLFPSQTSLYILTSDAKSFDFSPPNQKSTSTWKPFFWV